MIFSQKLSLTIMKNTLAFDIIINSTAFVMKKGVLKTIP